MTFTERVDVWMARREKARTRREQLRRWQSLLPHEQLAVFVQGLADDPAARKAMRRALRVRGLEDAPGRVR